MYNPISKALDEIKMEIPMDLLIEGFKDDYVDWRRQPASIDELIRIKVLQPRVLVDANLVGGQMMNIALDGVPLEFLDQATMIVTIPPALRNNRELVSVLSVNKFSVTAASRLAGLTSGSFDMYGSSDLTLVGQRIAESQSTIPNTSCAMVELIGQNTVMIKDNLRIPAIYSIRCIVSNDPNMNNLNPRSYLTFAELCVWAVKAYLFKQLRIKVDRAYLSGGQELGAFKETLDEYRDANENYKTCLREKWAVTAFQNDIQSHDRHLKMMINPGI